MPEERIVALLDPGSYLEKITHIWAFVASDANGEGICGYMTNHGLAVPLIAADDDRMNSIRPLAQMTADMSGKVVKLVKFTMREEIEELHPDAMEKEAETTGTTEG